MTHVGVALHAGKGATLDGSANDIVPRTSQKFASPRKCASLRAFHKRSPRRAELTSGIFQNMCLYKRKPSLCRGDDLRAAVRRERGIFRHPGKSGPTVDQSEDRTARPRTSVDRPFVLLISADPEVEVLERELNGSNTESLLLRNALEVESLTTREGFRAPDLVFVDLDSCQEREDIVAFVRALFAQASVVALTRTLDDERTERLLTLGVPSLKKPVSAGAFIGLAARLSRQHGATEVSDNASSRPGTGRLDALLETYSSARGLSPQQRLILRLHLAGNNDKEIACTCSCSEATVYEHWRRMARKAGGMHKGCVINDFHKFLDR